MENPNTIDPPRELRADERAVLEKLLSIHFPGVEALRQQIPYTRVREECGCGCPSVWLDVDRAQAPQAETDGSVPVEAFAPAPDDSTLIWIMLHVWEGFLDELELVPPEEDSPFPMPRAESLQVSGWE